MWTSVSISPDSASISNRKSTLESVGGKIENQSDAAILNLIGAP
jgi:hypothetical protein